jgi:hypothetical protein
VRLVLTLANQVFAVSMIKNNTETSGINHPYIYIYIYTCVYMCVGWDAARHPLICWPENINSVYTSYALEIKAIYGSYFIINIKRLAIVQNFGLSTSLFNRYSRYF